MRGSGETVSDPQTFQPKLLMAKTFQPLTTNLKVRTPGSSSNSNSKASKQQRTGLKPGFEEGWTLTHVDDEPLKKKRGEASVQVGRGQISTLDFE